MPHATTQVLTHALNIEIEEILAGRCGLGTALDGQTDSLDGQTDQ
jgi:hypothetical protein